MVNPLQKLQLAQGKLNKLNGAVAKKQNYESGGPLKKLETVNQANIGNRNLDNFETFDIVGSSIPKRWCPEVVPKVNSVAEVEEIVNEVLQDTQEADVRQIVYNIFSDPNEDSGILVINGGTP